MGREQHDGEEVLFLYPLGVLMGGLMVCASMPGMLDPQNTGDSDHHKANPEK